MADNGKRYIVQQYEGGKPRHWIDVDVVEAPDAGAALHAAVIRNPEHRIEATTYRVSEEALTVSVSINLEVVDAG